MKLTNNNYTDVEYLLNGDRTWYSDRTDSTPKYFSGEHWLGDGYVTEHTYQKLKQIYDHSKEPNVSWTYDKYDTITINKITECISKWENGLTSSVAALEEIKKIIAEE